MAESPRRRAKPAWAAAVSVALLGALWTTPVVMLGVGVLGARAQQQSSTTGAASGVVTVGSRQLDGRQDVTVTAFLGKVPEISADVQGVITAVNVNRGDAIADGANLLSVDGQALLAFSQEVPLFRDLTLGDSGGDVSGLGKFLVSVHLLDENAADSHLGPKMLSAVKEFQRRNGYDPDGVFRPSYVVFVPTDFGEVSDVDVRAGQKLSDQAVIAKGAPAVASLEMQPSGHDGATSALKTTEGLIAEIGNESVEISAFPPGIQDIEPLWIALSAGVDRGDLKQTSTATDSGTEVQFEGLQIARKDFTIRGSVPASAIFTASNGRSCVIESDSKFDSLQTGTSARAVSVTADNGEVGQTLVDPSLIGHSVVRDVSKVDPGILARCT